MTKIELTENEKTLRALSLLAAELHIQNHVSLAAANNLAPGYENVSVEMIPKLADHFKAYFEGGIFSPGTVMPVKVKRKRFTLFGRF